MKILNSFLLMTVLLTVGVFAQTAKTVSLVMSDDYALQGSVQLSPKRFFLVEFPPGDEVLMATSNDSGLIRGDEAFEEKNDASIPLLFRAGVNWNKEKENASLVIMMKSGAVLNLEIKPTDEVANSVERVVWQYNPEQVSKVRNRTLLTSAKNPEKPNVAVSTNVGVSSQDGMVMVSADKDIIALNTDESLPFPESPDLEAGKLAQETLVGLDGDNFKSFPKEKPINENPDLLIAALLSQWVKNGTWTLSVVGVQNKSRNAVQLVDFPRLRISTKGEKGLSLNDETIKPLGLATSAVKYPIILRPNEIVYFSYVFVTPVLGSTQSLQALASHTNLADKPAIISIRPGGSR